MLLIKWHKSLYIMEIRPLFLLHNISMCPKKIVHQDIVSLNRNIKVQYKIQ